MINKIILGFFVIFLAISIVLVLSKDFERKKSEKELKEIKQLKKEICS